MNESTTDIPIVPPPEGRHVPTEALRDGARRMPAPAVGAEVAAWTGAICKGMVCDVCPSRGNPGGAGGPPGPAAGVEPPPRLTTPSRTRRSCRGRRPARSSPASAGRPGNTSRRPRACAGRGSASRWSIGINHSPNYCSRRSLAPPRVLYFPQLHAFGSRKCRLGHGLVTINDGTIVRSAPIATFQCDNHLPQHVGKLGLRVSRPRTLCRDINRGSVRLAPENSNGIDNRLTGAEDVTR